MDGLAGPPGATASSAWLANVPWTGPADRPIHLGAAPSSSTGQCPSGGKVPRSQYPCRRHGPEWECPHCSDFRPEKGFFAFRERLQNEAPRFQGQRKTPAVVEPEVTAASGPSAEKLERWLDWANDPTWVLFWIWVLGLALLADVRAILWP